MKKELTGSKNKSKAPPMWGDGPAFHSDIIEALDILDSSNDGFPMPTFFDSVTRVNDVTYSSFSPERFLLCAILERASRDLEVNISSYDRRHAIKWFQTGFAGRPEPYPIIGFFDVLEHLELSDSRIQFLKNKLYAAEKYQKSLPRRLREAEEAKETVYKFEEKREQGGATVSPFSPRKRLPKCEAHSPVPREIRTSRCHRRRAA